MSCTKHLAQQPEENDVKSDPTPHQELARNAQEKKEASARSESVEAKRDQQITEIASLQEYVNDLEVIYRAVESVYKISENKEDELWNELWTIEEEWKTMEGNLAEMEEAFSWDIVGESESSGKPW